MGRAVQWTLLAEPSPPLQTDSPGIPDKRGPGVDADQQGRRISNVFPAVDLHSKPIVHQQVPEELLTLQGGLIEAAEIPFAGTLSYPAAQAALLLLTLVLHCGSRAIRLTACLRPHIRSSMVVRTHIGSNWAGYEAVSTADTPPPRQEPGRGGRSRGSPNNHGGYRTPPPNTHSRRPQTPLPAVANGR